MKWNVGILVLISGLSGCEQLFPDCWDHLSRLNDEHYLLLDNRQDFSADQLEKIRSSMASNVRKCSSDAPFAKDLSSVAVGIESYYTLIDFAIMANDDELVAALFEKQTQDPSLRYPEEKLTLGSEYLLNAAFSESDNVVRWLMNQGFDPNQTNDMGAAALHFSGARTDGGLRVARDLVAQGADIEMRAGNGVTPLILAWRQNGDLRKVQCLISLGAQIPSASEIPDIWPDILVPEADVDLVTAFLDSSDKTVPESISRICSNGR
jgi:hypothetical protein